MKKILGSILLVVYSIIAITVTVLLLSYNDYNCSEIGGYTVFIVNDDSLEPEYKQGSILLIKKTSDKNVQKGDNMFLYKVLNSQEYELVNRKLENKVQQGTHITYMVDKPVDPSNVTDLESSENLESYAIDYFVGRTSDTVVIEGWGYILSLLESKWGYLFCVVIVSLLLFLQEVFELSMEIRYGREERKRESAAKKSKKAAAGAKKNGSTASSNKTKSASGTTRNSSSTKSSESTSKPTSSSSKKTNSTTKKASNTTKKTDGAATKSSETPEDNNEANVEEE